MLSDHNGNTASSAAATTAISVAAESVITSASTSALVAATPLEASASTPAVAVVVTESNGDVIQAWQYSIADTVAPNTVLKELERLSKELAQLMHHSANNARTHADTVLAIQVTIAQLETNAGTDKERRAIKKSTAVLRAKNAVRMTTRRLHAQKSGGFDGICVSYEAAASELHAAIVQSHASERG
eukprot:5424-Heterococcus_DN1.PRE.1